MWSAAPEWLEAGASSDTGMGLVGYNAYLAGETEVFEGVKLIDDYTFSLTIAADPYLQSFHSDYCGTWLNYTQINDAELDQLIMDLRSVEPGDNDAFIDAWIAYEVRWQELMPQIPLFSNEFYDMASNDVQGLVISPLAYWSDVVCSIYKTAE